MSKSIYINMPTKDVAAARAFYEKTGFKINEQLSNDQNVLVIIDDRIILMLLAEDSYKQITSREIADTKTVSEACLTIEVPSHEEVDKIVDAGLAAGAKAEGETMDDDTMYSRGMSDLDGHRLNLIFMPSK